MKKESKSKKTFDIKKYIPYVIIVILFVIILVLINNKGVTKSVKNEKVISTTLEETSDLKKGISEVYESTVYIEVEKKPVTTIFGTVQESSSSGSGFIYKTDKKHAYILTNYHVIDDGEKFTVTFTSGKETEAKLLGGDEYYDIAVLRVDVPSDVKVANIGDSSKIELGDTVFTVGAPLGKDYMGTITKGIVSGTNRMVEIKIDDNTYMMEVLQTDASINSGNSGGPICNIKGQVIGITSSKLVGTGVEGMGFAIPINSVMDIIDSIEAGKEISRPYLGVQLLDLTNTFTLQYYYNIKISDDVTFGAVVAYIEDKKPADKAKLKVGDVIVSMDGEKVEDVSHFKYMIYKHKIGDKVRLKYYRDNKLNETTIELSEAIKSE